MQKYENYWSFLSQNFQFLEVKFSLHLNRCVFVMVRNLVGSTGHERQGLAEADTYVVPSVVDVNNEI